MNPDQTQDQQPDAIDIPPPQGVLPDSTARESLVDPRGETQLSEIFGGFPEVTAIPTWTPKNFQQSFALNSTTATIYYYDFSSNVWRTVSTGSTVYRGIVNADGTSGGLPSGWTSSRIGAGDYVITHNLGTALYAFVAYPLGAFVSFINSGSLSTTTVEVLIQSIGGGATNAMFTFILVPL